MVEPSRSCKKFKTRRDFPRLHPLSKRLMARWVCSNPMLILIGPLPLQLPHPSEMISIFIWNLIHILNFRAFRLIRSRSEEPSSSSLVLTELAWKGQDFPFPERSFHLNSPYSVIAPFRWIMCPTCASALSAPSFRTTARSRDVAFPCQCWSRRHVYNFVNRTLFMDFGPSENSITFFQF